MFLQVSQILQNEVTPILHSCQKSGDSEAIFSHHNVWMFESGFRFRSHYLRGFKHLCHLKMFSSQNIIGWFACLNIRRRNKALRHWIKVWGVKPPDPGMKNVQEICLAAKYDLVHPSPWSVSINQSSSCSSNGMLPSEEAGKGRCWEENVGKLPSNV